MKGCRGSYCSWMFQCRPRVCSSLLNHIVTPGSNERSSIVLLPVAHWVSGEGKVTYKFELKPTRGSNKRGGYMNRRFERSFQDPEIFDRYSSCVSAATRHWISFMRLGTPQSVISTLSGAWDGGLCDNYFIDYTGDVLHEQVVESCSSKDFRFFCFTCEI